MRKAVIASICLVCLLFCACVPSNEKDAVKDTLEVYFSALNSGNFTLANSLSVQAENSIKAEIDASEVNRFIFKDISYDVWSIKKDDSGALSAEIVVHQKSLNTAFRLTAEEYGEYIRDASASGKAYTDEALENKWNSMLLKNVKSIEETVTNKCSVPVEIDANGKAILKMTAEFRNCLFGGELDAIKALGA